MERVYSRNLYVKGRVREPQIFEIQKENSTIILQWINWNRSSRCTIKKILKTGYCNHIERLMILGNFMLLCEFDPDEVYRWFMEFFIDSYDWVMVPNVIWYESVF